MSREYALEVTAGATFRTTCKGCGAAYEAANKSWINAWRDAHTTECQVQIGART